MQIFGGLLLEIRGDAVEELGALRRLDLDLKRHSKEPIEDGSQRMLFQQADEFTRIFGCEVAAAAEQFERLQAESVCLASEIPNRLPRARLHLPIRRIQGQGGGKELVLLVGWRVVSSGRRKAGCGGLVVLCEAKLREEPEISRLVRLLSDETEQFLVGLIERSHANGQLDVFPPICRGGLAAGQEQLPELDRAGLAGE